MGRVGVSALALCAVLAAGATVASASEASSLRPACGRATVASGESGDLQLLSFHGEFGQVLGSGGQGDVLKSAAERTAGKLGAIRPCSSAGAKLQSDMLDFMGVQLAAQGCIDIVKHNPSFSGVDELLACIAPVNAAAVQLEREQASLEAAMAAHPCSGQGPSRPSAVGDAVAQLRKKAEEGERAVHLIEVMDGLGLKGLAATDETGLVDGYNQGLEAIDRADKTVNRISQIASLGGLLKPRSKRSRAAVAGGRPVPTQVQLWTMLLRSAHRFGDELQRDMNAVAADLRRKNLSKAHDDAGRAQFNADMLGISLRQADQVGSHFTSNLASDRTLGKRITSQTVRSLLEQITKGKVKIPGAVVTLSRSERAPARKQVNRTVGHTLLELVGGSLSGAPESRLLDSLGSLNLLGATTYR